MTSNEWKDIGSAPKDGTYIVAFERRSHQDLTRIVSWREDDTAKKFAWLDDSYDDWSLHWSSVPMDPTHWMPLPPPPVPSGEVTGMMGADVKVAGRTPSNEINPSAAVTK